MSAAGLGDVGCAFIAGGGTALDGGVASLIRSIKPSIAAGGAPLMFWNGSTNGIDALGPEDVKSPKTSVVGAFCFIGVGEAIGSMVAPPNRSVKASAEEAV